MSDTGTQLWVLGLAVVLVCSALGIMIAFTGVSSAVMSASMQVDVNPGDLSGSGTASDPYVITNASELQAMEDDLSAQYELGSDIDASGTAQWNNGNGFDPIGPSFNNKFKGVLNGAGHTIDGITISRLNEDRVGLIGVLDDEGTIRNVSAVNVNITGGSYTGGLVGTSDGTVVSSSVTGTVENTNNNAGGLAGSNDGLLKKSSAQVTVTGGRQIGGLVGLNSGTVRESYATGSVSASGVRVGGLVATNSNGAIVSNSYATGTVTGNSKIGGLVGLNLGTIQQTVAVGSVSGSSDIGGLVGNNTAAFAKTPGTVEDSYFDEQATGQPTSAGNATDLTTAQMTGQAAQTNMTGLAFGTVWQVQDEDYPALSWQVNSSGGGDVSADLVVDADGTQDYETIQAAVDNATDGDTVEVRSGTYTESVVIRKNITLVAPSGATVQNASVSYPAGIQVLGPATPTVSGFTITGWQSGFSAGGSDGAWTLQDTVIRDTRLAVGGAGTPAPWTVTNVTVVNSTYGLSAYQSSGDWVVRDSTFRRNGSSISADESSGDWTVERTTVRNTTDAAINAVNSSGRWTVRNATLGDNEDGITADESTNDWTVQETVIEDAANNGLSAEKTSGNWTLEGVTIRNSSDQGIEADDSSGNTTIRDTIVSNVSHDGIEFDRSSGDWTIENTTVRNTTDAGIDAGSSSGDPVIRESVVRNTGFHGIEVEKSTGAWTIEDSTVENTARDGIDAFKIVNGGTIDNVTIRDTNIGVNLYNSSGPWTITDSVVENNSGAAVGAANTDGEWEVRQSILTNGTGVALDANDALIEGNASYNYWGAPDGPAGDFPGSGGEAFGNVSVDPYYTDAALTTLSSGVTVSGVVITDDGTPAANDFVTANPVDTGERDRSGLVVNQTSDNGAFSLNVESGREYEIRVFRFDESAGTLGVDDGTVDVYAVDRRSFGSDVDYGDVTLPEGHDVNVTVIDEASDPVENANVSIVHTNDAKGATAALVDSPTKADGSMVAKAIPNLGVTQSTAPGLELAGNVTMSVTPPSGSPLNGNSTQVSVGSDREVTIVLDDPSTSFVASDGSGDYETIQAAVEDASDNETIIVKDGTYSGVSADTDNVTLRAAEGATPIIEGGGLPFDEPVASRSGPGRHVDPMRAAQSPSIRQLGFVRPVPPQSSAILVEADDVTIEGFDIRNPRSGVGIEVEDDIDGTTIRNNDIQELGIEFVLTSGEQNGVDSLWGLDVGPSTEDSFRGLDGGSAGRAAVRNLESGFDGRRSFGRLGAGEFGSGKVTGILVSRGDHTGLTITNNRIENPTLDGSAESVRSVASVTGISVESETLSDSKIDENVIADLQGNGGPAFGIAIRSAVTEVSISNNEISNIRTTGDGEAEGESGEIAAGILLAPGESEITPDIEITNNDISGVKNSDRYSGAISVPEPLDDSNVDITGNRLQSNVGLYSGGDLAAKCNYWGGSLGPVVIQGFNEDGTVQTEAGTVDLDTRDRSAVTDNVEFRGFYYQDPADIDGTPACRSKVPVPLNLTVETASAENGTLVDFALTETLDGQPVTGSVTFAGETAETSDGGGVAFVTEQTGTLTATATKEDTDRKNFTRAEATVTIESDESETTTGDGGAGGGGSSLDDGPTFDVDATVPSRDIEAGETLTITVTVRNTGERPDEFEIGLAVDGESTDTSETVELGAGEETEVTLEYVISRAGEYDIAVAGTNLGSVTVSQQTDQPTEEGTSEPQQDARPESQQDATPEPQQDVTSESQGGETPESAATPQREPAGFGLLPLVGLVAVVAVIALLAVVRYRNL